MATTVEIITYWVSRNGGRWERCEVFARSVVGVALGHLAQGEIYDDGSGYRYKWGRG